MKRNGGLIVLTGASSGIGRCLAALLVRERGCRVIGIGRSAERLARVKEELGDAFEPLSADITDPAVWEKLSARFAASREPLDGLILCAGVLPRFDRAERVPAETFEETMRINFTADVVAVKALTSALSAAADPFVVAVSSAGGIAPLVGTAAYAASKSAMRAYFEVLREEWQGKIAVTVVCPGFVATDIFRHQSGMSESEKLLRSVAASPERTARAILRAADRKCRYRVLGVDGHLLSIGMRIAPKTTPRLCRRVLRAVKLPLFENVFR